MRLNRAEVTVYDKTFSFPPPGTPDFAQTRRAAIAEASAYGQQRQSELRATAGRELTKREQLAGRIIEPKTAEPMRLMPHPSSDVRNVYSTMLDAAKSRVTHTAGERAQKERRIAHAQALFDARELELMREEAVTAHANDPETARARAFAAQLELSPDLTAQQKADAQRLKTYMDAPLAQASQFWSQATAAGLIGATPQRPAVGIETDVTARLAARDVYEANNG